MNLRSLPKAELHCHLDGILSPAMARAIRRDDATFPIAPEDFAPYYPITNVESFFHWWRAVDPINGQLECYFPILAQHIAALKVQNTHYAEIMIGSSEVPRDITAAIEAFTALHAWVNRHAAGDITVAFLVIFGRGRTPETAEEIADRVIALYEADLVVGIALAGLEDKNPVRAYTRTFDRCHETGMGIEIHAGEWCGPESVWDALEHGHPNRIGHGVSLFQDPALIELFQERQIHIEMCPTSNLKTGSVARIEEHPIRQARDLGLNFSINTDDPGPFLNSLTSEYQLLVDTFGFDEADFRQVYENTLRARFGNSDKPLTRTQIMKHPQQSVHNLFTGYGLDRVHHQLQDEMWVTAQLAHPDTRFLAVWRLQPLVAPGDPPRPVWLTPEAAAAFLAQAASLTVLGVAEGRTYATFDLPAPVEPPATLAALGEFQDLRRVSPLLNRFDGGMLAYARAMAYWHAQHRFCGACGSPTESREGGHLRVCTNPQCEQLHFPRTDPAIIVCTTCGDKILLGRQPTWAKGRYSNIAGFVAPGESLEDAVVREVQEETGACVAAVHYHSSQPWPFPSSLMLGFTAEAVDDTLCAGPDCNDGELEDFRWFTRSEIHRGLEAGTFGLPSRSSISFRLIEDWFDAGDQGHLAPLKLRYNPD